MQITLATPDDIETLFDIRTSIEQNHQSREELSRLGVTPDSLAGMLRTRSRAWLAHVEGNAVGFSMADSARATVFALFVRPGHERRGIGRRLMAEAETWLFRQGWDQIWLATGSDESLRAWGFYRHLGWVPAGVLDDRQVRFVKRRVTPGSS
ncbi:MULTISPECIES: GNAT family N-acetyltransferase [unclassified Paracoccus (in: a-proteobacteria)]|uniref:GNAT family N-acetyltransferase n=1 Tax=unclassified Paracoccus (in: a-proteobacteria) TaxID=2688777 RepID=UPI001600D728|nr:MULTISPECIES: GNAT family N-acetyltransferase [unclassified Paracoccus (in: a-proteobacteria)]MBB1489981.1 GNAT family N-acetyltransferase [Paracoccus sp. MC1854]MBB1496569.1 GNAT family N-acetyltransferase [Paracoccus sp. MC1862]QQO43592.1 GNAT family N-acetyltransferase [Paracoccus sp. MC1862]